MRPINSMNDSIYGRENSVSTRQLAISQFVSRTYGWMFLGLMITGFVSWGVVSSETALSLIFSNRMAFYGVLFAELGLVMWMSARINQMSATAATLGFITYSALTGVTLSVIFMAYTLASIAQVFWIAAGMFGGLALFGTLTKKDLTGLGSFFGMGVWGLILVGIANVFIGSEALSLGASAAGVLIFSGLTAYNAQGIRGLAYQYAAAGGFRSQESRKGSIFGALVLYLNFINLFLSLLRLLGNRRN